MSVLSSSEVFGGSVGFREPLTSSFGGRGVRTYVEMKDGVCYPKAILPAPDTTRLGGLAEWFSVAAACMGRGMRTGVESQDPEEVSPVPSSETELQSQAVVDQAFSPPEPELQHALSEVSDALTTRNLPVEREDPNDGTAYLGLFRTEARDEILRVYGTTPSLSDLAKIPLEWLRPAGDVVQIGVVVRGERLHFQENGGDGKLSAYDLISYARTTKIRAGSVDLPLCLMDAKVGGDESREDDVVVVDDPDVAGVPFPREKCGGEIDSGQRRFDETPSGSRLRSVVAAIYRPGYCYEKLFPLEERGRVTLELGPYPSLANLIQYESKFVSDSDLKSLYFRATDRDKLHLESSVCGLTGPNTCACPDDPDGYRCLFSVVRDEFGPVVLNPGVYVERVFDKNVVQSWRDPARYYVRRGAKLRRSLVGSPLRHLLMSMCIDGQVVCCPNIPIHGTRCPHCWYPLKDGHEQRCSANVKFKGDRCAAWLGDAQHLLDVRAEIAALGVTPSEATVWATHYVSNEAQSDYVVNVLRHPRFGSERDMATWFETVYTNELRNHYLFWLRADLVKRVVVVSSHT